MPDERVEHVRGPRCNLRYDRDPVLVDLALQGGGSHGAFTWGVLDRLLEEPWLRIDAISGTSAGAMNAAVLADGWTEGGASGARAALDAYWERVAKAAANSPLQRTLLDRLEKRWEASRGQQNVGGQLRVAEDAAAAGVNVGRRDEQLDRRLRQPLEVDALVQDGGQRIEAEWIELIGRDEARHQVECDENW